MDPTDRDLIWLGICIVFGVLCHLHGRSCQVCSKIRRIKPVTRKPKRLEPIEDY